MWEMFGYDVYLETQPFKSRLYLCNANEEEFIPLLPHYDSHFKWAARFVSRFNSIQDFRINVSKYTGLNLFLVLAAVLSDETTLKTMQRMSVKYAEESRACRQNVRLALLVRREADQFVGVLTICRSTRESYRNGTIRV